jgi:serine/threonine protein kinase
MHAKNFVHNDIKPDNILLDKDEKGIIFPVITDFGVVHVLDSADKIKGMKLVHLNAATKNYAAPEILKCLKERVSKTFGKSSDVFSVGIVCLELYSRRRARGKFDEDQVIKGLLPSHKPESLLGTIQIKRDIFELINKCISHQPELRPSLDQVSDRLYKLGNNSK